jgi:hypothetical protein
MCMQRAREHAHLVVHLDQLLAEFARDGDSSDALVGILLHQRVSSKPPHSKTKPCLEHVRCNVNGRAKFVVHARVAEHAKDL